MPDTRPSFRYAINFTYLDGAQESESGSWPERDREEFWLYIHDLQQDPDISRISYSVDGEEAS